MNTDLILKFLHGHHTPEEKKRIVEWLDADPVNNQKEFDRVRYLFETTLLDPKRVQTGAQPAARRGVRIPAAKFVRRAAGIAAALLLIVGGGYAVRNATYDSISARMTSIEVPAGQRVRIALSDGTQVWLNSQTRIEYPSIFDRRQRRVKLSGEAMFEVTHDAEWPFVVETFASDVEVLGTKFNVAADSLNCRFSTTLLEGSVKVFNMMNGQSQILMQPDDMVSLVDGRFCKSRLENSADMCCWPQGLLNVRKSFPELMSEMEKVFAIKIVVERQTLPRIDYVSGQIRISDGIDHALKVLQYASDFTFEHDNINNVITIR